MTPTPTTPARTARGRNESGMALLSTLLVMMLMSALLVGFFAMVASDQRASGSNRDQTRAYAAAHAGLEKLTSDLGLLFTGGNYSPSAAELSALTAAPPSLSGFEYEAPDGTSGYTLTAQPVQTTTIQAGPFQGLVGLITPYEINVTAHATGGEGGGGAEVRMRRELQTVAVPVFQFGVFSEGNLNFAAAPSFAFGGRVHTNQNLFLAHQSGATLTLEDKVTAVGEVVRTHLSNGWQITPGNYDGTVKIAKATGVYANLLYSPNQGSVSVSSSAAIPPATLQMVGDPPKPTMVLVAGATENNATWTGISTGTFNGWLKDGTTGAKRLDLPLVSDGAAPIDLVRRPPIDAPDNANLQQQRFYHLASLRILLSDRASELEDLQGVTADDPVDLWQMATDAAYRAGRGIVLSNNIPLGLAGTYSNATAAGPTAGFGYRVPVGSPIQTGFIKIERQDNSGVWHDVTVELLNLGFTGRNLANGYNWNTANTTCATSANDDPSPNAVIRLQRVRDNPLGVTAAAATGACGHVGLPGVAGAWAATTTNYVPLALYDAREGSRRDDERTVAAGGISNAPPFLGGVMHYVELDVYNLRRWITGVIGTTGDDDTMSETGYVVYFSDRRGNKNLGDDNVAGAFAGADGLPGTADDYGDDEETAELGFEDVVNPNTYNSPSDGVMNQGEDFNSNGTLELYGGAPRPRPNLQSSATAYPWNGQASAGVAATPMTVVGTLATTALQASVELRVNPPLFFRRGLKLVNGGYTTGVLRLPANGSQGLTVASENPTYVQGNYNGPNAAGTAWGTTPGTDHVSAAVIADSVTLLSNAWNDIRSFSSPHAVSGRVSSNTWYRLALVSGKGVEFPRPTTNTAYDDTDYGTDGGVNNFIRYMESWSGRTSYYLGSLVSFYYSRQGVGTYKCCNIVFGPPIRNYRFDTEFLQPSLLPPRTPMFRDINALTFRQVLRPTQ